jgi:hypothetical protein
MQINTSLVSSSNPVIPIKIKTLENTAKPVISRVFYCFNIF